MKGKKGEMGKEQPKLTELCAGLRISLLHSDLMTFLPSSRYKTHFKDEKTKVRKPYVVCPSGDTVSRRGNSCTKPSAFQFPGPGLLAARWQRPVAQPDFLPSIRPSVSPTACPTFPSPVDRSPPGASVHGILQARIQEWVAIPFSRGFSWPRIRTQVS